MTVFVLIFCDTVGGLEISVVITSPLPKLPVNVKMSKFYWRELILVIVLFLTDFI